MPKRKSRSNNRLGDAVLSNSVVSSLLCQVSILFLREKILYIPLDKSVNQGLVLMLMGKTILGIKKIPTLMYRS